MRLFSKHFRTIAGTSFRIDKIYPSYRQGFDKTTNKMNAFVKQGDEWKKKEWDGEKFALIEGKPDFKLHKKVYDIDLVLSEDKAFDFKGESKSDSNVTVTLSAYMIGEMMKATVAFGKEIPQNNGRDQFDWEEEYLENIIGTTLVFSVTGEGIGTSYTFKEAKAFDAGVREEVSEEVKEVEEILGVKEETKEETKEDIDDLF